MESSHSPHDRYCFDLFLWNVLGPHLVAGEVHHLLLSMIDDRPKKNELGWVLGERLAAPHRRW